MDNSKYPYKFKWESDKLLVDEKVFSHRCVQPECTGCDSDTNTQEWRFNYPYLPDGESTGWKTFRDECSNTIHDDDADWYYWSRGSEKQDNFGGQHWKGYQSPDYSYDDEYSLGITSWEYKTAHSSRLQIDAT